MRKSVIAVLVAGSAFALTSAAAGAITVTGPFNPRAGTGAVQQCNPGATTVSTNETGVDVTGFTVTTTNDLSAVSTCTGKWLWVNAPPPPPPPKAAYVRLDAHINYTTGHESSTDMAGMSSTVALAATGTPDLANLPVATNAIGDASILVTALSAPTAF